MTEAGDRDDAWYEREYNPRVTVADTAALLASWPERSRAVLARRAPDVADHAYGDHPREILDVFHAENARGALVFVHGGYWRSFTKSETAFLVEGFLGQGVSVVLVNYPLAPEVTVGRIAESVRNAFAAAYRLLSEAERRAVVVAGHSAGGHLAVDLMTVDWAARGLPAEPMRLVLPISGLFDLAPLLRTSMNAQIGLTPETAAAWSLITARPRVEARLVAAVGGDEPAEFHRQSEVLAAAWSALGPRVIAVPGTNHFTVLDHLAEPGAVLNRMVVEAVASASDDGRVV